MKQIIVGKHKYWYDQRLKALYFDRRKKKIVPPQYFNEAEYMIFLKAITN